MEGSGVASWRECSYSGNNGGDCVEAGSSLGTVLVRDTKQGGYGSVLQFTAATWQTFADRIKNDVN